MNLTPIIGKSIYPAMKGRDGKLSAAQQAAFYYARKRRRERAENVIVDYDLRTVSRLGILMATALSAMGPRPKFGVHMATSLTYGRDLTVAAALGAHLAAALYRESDLSDQPALGVSLAAVLSATNDNLGVGTTTISGIAAVGNLLTAAFNNDDPNGSIVGGPIYTWNRPQFGQATNSIIFGQPSDGDTLTIGSQAYTFRTTMAAPFDIKIDAGNTLTCSQYTIDAINGANVGTSCFAGTTPNTQVSAAATSPGFPDITLTVLAAAGVGILGNGIACSSTGGNLTINPTTDNGYTDYSTTTLVHTGSTYTVQTDDIGGYLKVLTDYNTALFAQEIETDTDVITG